jgi:hypothetical protein
MHPSGVQFGLSRGLLRLEGEEVVLSDKLLDTISLEAQWRIHSGKPPIDDMFLVDVLIRSAREAIKNEQNPRRQEVVPFLAGLSRTLYTTLSGVAARAGLGQREGNQLVTSPELWNEFTATAALNVKAQKRDHGMAKLQKGLFKVCRELVGQRYAQNDPDNARHADLIALFIFNLWNATGLLPMAQAMVILGSDVHSRSEDKP